MSKETPVYALGRNIEGWLEEGGILTLRIDTNKQGPQTEGSKAEGKSPNEMVGSTGSHINIPGSNLRLMCHVTRPMTIQATRKARALRELDSEQPADLAALAQKLKGDPKLMAELAKLK
jgi:hypothetical protein